MPKPENAILGAKLLKLRKDYKMTQSDVAKLIGMNRTSFSKYETGLAYPSLPVLRKLADVYNVGLEYLIFDDNTSIRVSDSGAKSSGTVVSVTDLEPDEKELVTKFRVLSKEKKEEILNLLYQE